MTKGIVLMAEGCAKSVYRLSILMPAQLRITDAFS